MKRLLVLVLMWAGIQGMIQAQMVINVVDPNETMKAEPVDEVQFIVQYQLTAVADTLHPEKTDEETMMLQVGTKSARYYSYTRFVTDSLFREQLKKSEGGMVRQHRTPDQNPGRQTAQLYKNYPSGKVTTLDQIATSRFRCEEVNDIPQWELHPDTTTILSYSCQKATCRFKGRDYEAWFTLEIPRSEGPWKLQGLPGLILRAEDSRGHYRFECTGLIRPEGPESIMFGAENYQPVSRKDLTRVYERFAADPMGFVSSTAPNVRLVIKGPDGEAKKPKDTPYNPIELQEK